MKLKKLIQRAHKLAGDWSSRLITREGDGYVAVITPRDEPDQ